MLGKHHAEPMIKENVGETEGLEKASQKRQLHRLALELDVNRWSERGGVKAQRWAWDGIPPGLSRRGKGKKSSYMGTRRWNLSAQRMLGPLSPDRNFTPVALALKTNPSPQLSCPLSEMGLSGVWREAGSFWKLLQLA